ncbi:Deoxyguanosinetriphosphate triphosphohydrolase [Devosia equisanguinis]|uniref:Deoxyguanosinetriphosphate triphosphohydrolase-like protein n=1 Tax=Devosia equisanguinis TaxID=2490941 RepID=A0A3S4GKC5_9HYPH|nr:dNTP triphosphohydrolase [Devosia equisanguinis]VDS06741.1 Deoxyguanosinetriphosphate triphosphohydrolase [Devosia equisanguinis]
MARKGLYKKSDWTRLTSETRSARLTPEHYRAEVRRDYARLIHSPAFRRLQGKTQLFPGQESDFFRNRLTHSMEVAQIAKSIAIRLNGLEAGLTSTPIDTDLVEFAGLAHDIGHPPFGHNGEHALDQLMLDNGGFEGNAQTLRLLSRIEKKVTEDFPFHSNAPVALDLLARKDLRRGLNLTARSLASILKYDEIIPSSAKARDAAGTQSKAHKGYYELEADIVSSIKSKVGVAGDQKFKTVECQIMDVADDIAYSTYDLEDSFKADFSSPLMMIAMSDDFKRRLCKKVSKNIEENYKDHPPSERQFDVEHINNILAEIFSGILSERPDVSGRFSRPVTLEEAAFILSSSTHDASKELCRNGYIRTAFTSYLVGDAIRSVEFFYDANNPALSKVKLSLARFKVVETLKHFSFQLLIESPRLKLAEKRGTEIINKVFKTLNDDHALLPEDWRALCSSNQDSHFQQRTICDYIAGMTDQYCVELHSRITGTNPPSMWKPH